jgi:tetratricopeptide (TPR) repeat protein
MEKLEFKRFIERYLEGNMQPAEKRWFEMELDGNRWLRDELELRRKTDSIVENSAAMDFKKRLILAEQKHRKVAPLRRALTSTIAQYAAIFIGMIIIASMAIMVSRSFSPDISDSGYIAKFDPGMSSRAVGTVSDDAFNKAIDLYNQGDYTNAIIWFEMFVDDIRSTFMIGASNMEIKRYKEAIAPLEKEIDHNDNLFIEEARWRLSQCYIKTEETEKAIDELEIIANSNSKYNKKAKRNLRKIR